MLVYILLVLFPSVISWLLGGGNFFVGVSNLNACVTSVTLCHRCSGAFCLTNEKLWVQYSRNNMYFSEIVADTSHTHGSLTYLKCFFGLNSIVIAGTGAERKHYFPSFSMFPLSQNCGSFKSQISIIVAYQQSVPMQGLNDEVLQTQAWKCCHTIALFVRWGRSRMNCTRRYGAISASYIQTPLSFFPWAELRMGTRLGIAISAIILIGGDQMAMVW